MASLRDQQAGPAIPNRRKERSPYTSIACDECQRRKVKCTGGQPCKGCETSQKTCVYKRTTRFRASSNKNTIKTLSQSQETHKSTPVPPPVQFRDIASNADDRAGSLATITAPGTPLRQETSNYYLSLAQARFHALSPNQQLDGPSPLLRISSNHLWQKVIDHNTQVEAGIISKDVLQALSAQQWEDVLDLYEEEVGTQYPLLDMGELRDQIRTSIVTREQTSSNPTATFSSLNPGSPKWQQSQDIATLMIACVSSIADPDVLEPTRRTVEQTAGAAIGRTLFGKVNRDDLIIIILASMYYFFSDLEVLAWRGIATVVRLLHESTCHDPIASTPLPQQPANEFKEFGEKLYWSAYALDRRWGLGTGLPFAIQDADIPFQPKFSDGSFSSTYLQSMVVYCRIASEVRLASSETSPYTRQSTRDFLNFRVVEWQKGLPSELQFHEERDKVFDLAREPRREYKLRLILYLRANQMRTIIYRKFAVQPDQQSVDQTCINPMVENARATIRVMLSIVDDPDIYWGQRKTFNFYLELALSSLLLVLCFSKNARGLFFLKDIQTGLDLVDRLSLTSAISRKLWENLRGFRDSVNLAISTNEGMQTVPTSLGEAEQLQDVASQQNFASSDYTTLRGQQDDPNEASANNNSEFLSLSQGGPSSQPTGLDGQSISADSFGQTMGFQQSQGETNGFLPPELEQMLFDYDNIYSF